MLAGVNLPPPNRLMATLTRETLSREIPSLHRVIAPGQGPRTASCCKQHWKSLPCSSLLPKATALILGNKRVERTVANYQSCPIWAVSEYIIRLIPVSLSTPPRPRDNSPGQSQQSQSKLLIVIEIALFRPTHVGAEGLDTVYVPFFDGRWEHVYIVYNTMKERSATSN